MNNGRKKIVSCLFFVMFLLMATSVLAADKSKWPSKMNIAAGPLGSSGFVPMSSWAPLMNSILGTNISPEATGGITISTQMVDNNQAHLGISTTDQALEGWEGTAKWTKGSKLRNFRAMAVIDPFAVQFWSLRANNITNIYQINGRSINVSRAGSSADVWGRRIFEMFNIKPSKINNLNPGDANNLLADRLLDVASTHGSCPHPAAVEASVNNDIVVFGLPDKERKAMLEKYSTLYELHVPSNTYKGQKEHFSTVATYTVMIAHKDLPDDLVFELLDTTFKNKDQMAVAYKPYIFLSPENVKHLGVPLHKGAYRYYQRAGISVPKAAMPIE